MPQTIPLRQDIPKPRLRPITFRSLCFTISSKHFARIYRPGIGTGKFATDERETARRVCASGRLDLRGTQTARR